MRSRISADEFGFEVIAVAGLNQEQDTAPRDLAATLEAVRESRRAGRVSREQHECEIAGVDLPGNRREDRLGR